MRRSAGFCGHVSLDCVRKLGPFTQRWSESAETPLDASSAGLEWVSTYLHWDGVDTSCIVATRFATKV